MPAIDIGHWMKSLLAQLQQSRQRQLVQLQGPAEWCDEQLDLLLQFDAELLLLSNRDNLTAATPFSKAETLLGSETRIVVVDLFDGFNADVLCIAGGLVRAGGILALLSPDGDTRAAIVDRYACWQDGRHSASAFFVEYFFRALRADSKLGIRLTSDSLPAAPPVLPRLQETPIQNGRTAEQTEALRSIESWARGQQGGCVLLSAERGRGKSTCLGMLAASLQGRLRVLVSANSRQTAAALLRRAPGIEFVAPDVLLQECPEADLLLLDEAAMIPLPMLRQLTRLYPKLVMATTSGGYEGTGQGFLLRFVSDMKKRGLIQLRLERPVRWCEGDLLEAWLGRTLLLQQETRVTTAPTPAKREECRITQLEQPGAAESWPLLRQVYALLNTAHYRTRPSDLRMLMENPDLCVFVALNKARVVGVVLLNPEGGFDASLCREIFLGRRRPQGHLLAQMLTAQAGLKGFAGYRGLRVQRIAVAADCRREGLGTELLEAAFEYARDNGLDYVGASFALDVETADFWRQAGYRLVHISYARGKSSGDHSIAVLRPLSDALEAGIEQLRQRIRSQLPIWLIQFLRFMEAEQVAVLLRLSAYRGRLSELEQQEVEAFAKGNKGFELCFVSLQKFVMHKVAATPAQPHELLIEKGVQNRPWKLLVRESGASGRKQLQQRLRQLVDDLGKGC